MGVVKFFICVPTLIFGQQTLPGSGRMLLASDGRLRRMTVVESSPHMSAKEHLLGLSPA